MNQQQQAVVQMALEFMDDHVRHWTGIGPRGAHIRDALRKLLEAEPVVPLTDDQTKLFWHKARLCMGSNRQTVFKNLIEDHHGIK